MKVKLIRDARINHAAGEIVEVSPETADFLVSVGSAARLGAPKAETANVEVKEVAEKAVKTPTRVKKTTKK